MQTNVASARNSYSSIGSGLRPRPSSAFKLEKKPSFQEAEPQKQTAVQTSDLHPSYCMHDPSVYEIAVQVTGNEAAVQTSSSIKQYGHQGFAQAVGSDALQLLTPLTTSENWEYEYSRMPRSPVAGETTSAAAVDAAKTGSKDSVTSRQTQSDKGAGHEPFITSKESLKALAATEEPSFRKRPSSGPQQRQEIPMTATKTVPKSQTPEQVKHMPRGNVIQKEEVFPAEVKVYVQSQQELVRNTLETMPKIQSAEIVQQKRLSSKEESKKSDTNLVEEFVEYEEITEVSAVSPKAKHTRRLSFVPNFATPVAVIGTYGQQNRRMSFFPGYNQKEQGTRSVLEKAMDPELPTPQTNRDNFTMDEDDDVQIVSPLVSNTSVSDSNQRSRQSSGATNRSTNRSKTSTNSRFTKSSAKPSRQHMSDSRFTNTSNNNVSLTALSVNNAKDNTISCSRHESEKNSPLSLQTVVSPSKTGDVNETITYMDDPVL